MIAVSRILQSQTILSTKANQSTRKASWYLENVAASSSRQDVEATPLPRLEFGELVSALIPWQKWCHFHGEAPRGLATCASQEGPPNPAAVLKWPSHRGRTRGGPPTEGPSQARPGVIPTQAQDMGGKFSLDDSSPWNSDSSHADILEQRRAVPAMPCPNSGPPNP